MPKYVVRMFNSFSCIYFILPFQTAFLEIVWGRQLSILKLHEEQIDQPDFCPIETDFE